MKKLFTVVREEEIFKRSEFSKELERFRNEFKVKLLQMHDDGINKVSATLKEMLDSFVDMF
jgi:hypothetical protein